MIKILIPLLSTLLISSCGDKGNNDNAGVKVDGRWYTQTQVDKGLVIYANNCARCHGKEAESTSKWRETLANGSYPPPPLNGTAHAWHHPLKALRRTIRSGGIPLGGTMPAFKNILNEEQTDAVIASFQSKWDKRIYDAWIERGGLK